MRIWLLHILILFAAPLFAQTGEGRGADDSANPRERLYVHTARPYILAGETLHFRIYRALGSQRVPDPLSKVAYVELLDPEGKVALQSRVLMQANGGPGHFVVPLDVRSGVYTLRAYTRWMRNGGVDEYYHQPVTVINTLRRLGLKPEPKGFTINLFPEGGDLVDGLESVCGLMVRTAAGDPLEGELALLKQDTVPLGLVNADEFGLATLRLIPEQGMKISAVILGDTIPVKVPVISAGGAVIHAQRRDNGYHVGIRSTRNENGPMTLAVISEGQIIASRKLELRDGAAETTIGMPELPAGVSILTLFNAQEEPVAERLVFNQPGGRLDLEIKPEQAYRVRDEVGLDITSSREEAELSVSVYMWDAAMEDRIIDIHDYFWLTGELRGLTYLPAEYLSPEKDVYDQHIEHLLLTYGWRRYQAAEPQRDETLLPEFRQPLLTGSAKRPGSLIYASMPSTDEKLFVARARDDGHFTFEIPNVRGDNRMIIQSPANTEITIDDPFDARTSVPSSLPFDIESGLQDFLVRANENMQVTNYFNPAAEGEAARPSPFYGIADVSYLLDDYTRFPVMEEVFREYVYGVYVRKRNGEFYLRVLDEGGEDRFPGEPLILVDGVPVFDTDALMAMDPLKIRQIDVIRRKYGYGPAVADGIVALYSYDNSLGGFSPPRTALEITYHAAQRYKEFYIPVREDDPLRRRPDFRNQAYWSPSVKVSGGRAKVGFTLPDNSGMFMIVIHGMDGKGNFGTAKKVLVAD